MVGHDDVGAILEGQGALDRPARDGGSEDERCSYGKKRVTHDDPHPELCGLGIRHNGLKNGDENGSASQQGSPRVLPAISWSEGCVEGRGERAYLPGS